MLSYVCPVCRSQASLELVICQAVDDAQARQMIEYLIKTYQPSLGAATLRYLRLHTPAKQRLSWARVRRVLGELVEAMRSRKVNRAGRDWPVGVEDWQAAFEAVFEAQGKGTLVLPLKDNAYLYAILVRRVDKSEAIAEAKAEMERRAGPRGAHVPGAVVGIGQAVERVMGAVMDGGAGSTATADSASRPQAQSPAQPSVPVGPSLAVRRMQEERERNLERRQRLLQRAAKGADVADVADAADRADAAGPGGDVAPGAQDGFSTMKPDAGRRM